MKLCHPGPQNLGARPGLAKPTDWAKIHAEWTAVQHTPGFLPSLVLAIVVALAAVVLSKTSSFHTGVLCVERDAIQDLSVLRDRCKLCQI